jgi:hypothetical protein
MTIRLAVLALPLLFAAGCASGPATEPQRTSQLERPEDCPTGTRVCKRGTSAASSGVSTMSADDLRRSRVGTGVPSTVAR